MKDHQNMKSGWSTHVSKVKFTFFPLPYIKNYLTPLSDIAGRLLLFVLQYKVRGKHEVIL